MKDIVVVALMIVGFAFLLTVHVAIAFGLVKQRPRWHALLAFFVPPLAPWFALRQQMRKRGFMWIGGAVVYAIAVLLGSL